MNDWCDIVSHALDLNLPWRTLKSRLVQTDSEGFVIYESTFRSKELQFSSNIPIKNVNILLISISLKSFLFFSLSLSPRDEKVFVKQSIEIEIF